MILSTPECNTLTAERFTFFTLNEERAAQCVPSAYNISPPTIVPTTKGSAQQNIISGVAASAGYASINLRLFCGACGWYFEGGVNACADFCNFGERANEAIELGIPDLVQVLWGNKTLMVRYCPSWDQETIIRIRRRHKSNSNMRPGPFLPLMPLLLKREFGKEHILHVRPPQAGVTGNAPHVILVERTLEIKCCTKKGFCHSKWTIKEFFKGHPLVWESAEQVVSPHCSQCTTYIMPGFMASRNYIDDMGTQWVGESHTVTNGLR
ncbi:unnamed protein product [Allacma fusca]|uniref:Uncharacterized protein n=1 Tax=Allacma fusca TaxID=39272 RepID=A0A8J2JHT5_9HEXA|nr:unnamed protein product [Allacma fusca]